MKKFLLIFLSILSFNVQAQITRIDTLSAKITTPKSSTYKSPRLYTYTIGIQLLSIEEYPKILNQVNSNQFIKGAFNGVFLKINDNQISYRLSASFLSEDVDFRNECEDCEQADGKMNDFSAKVGFEKNFIYGTVQPYLAFDLGFRRNSFNGDVENATTLAYTNPYSVTTLKNGFLISPSLGVKFNVLNHLTFSAETGLGLLYNYEKQEKTYEDVNRTRTFEDFKKWEFLLKPLSMLSVQYNFGATY